MSQRIRARPEDREGGWCYSLRNTRLLNDELKQRRSLRVAQQLTVDVRGTQRMDVCCLPQNKVGAV